MDPLDAALAPYDYDDFEDDSEPFEEDEIPLYDQIDNLRSREYQVSLFGDFDEAYD